MVVQNQGLQAQVAALQNQIMMLVTGTNTVPTPHQRIRTREALTRSSRRRGHGGQIREYNPEQQNTPQIEHPQ